MLHYIYTHIGPAIAVIFWLSIFVGLALELYDEWWQRHAKNWTYDEDTGRWRKP